MAATKLSYNAIHILYEAADGRNHAFVLTEQPFGWSQLERAGLAVRDGYRAVITPAGQNYLRANPRAKIAGKWTVL